MDQFSALQSFFLRFPGVYIFGIITPVTILSKTSFPHDNKKGLENHLDQKTDSNQKQQIRIQFEIRAHLYRY